MPLSSGREAAFRKLASREGRQLDLWADRSGRPDLTPTAVLARHASCARVLELVRQVRGFFPELDGRSIRVGLTRAAAGFASREESWIWINPRRLVRHTIAHELTHLLQNDGLLPGGEKAADLFALARHATLADDLPSYLETPRSLREVFHDAGRREQARVCSLLHVTARDAAQARAGGERYYLAWFERELEERWEQLAEPLALGPRSAVVQSSLF